MKYFYLFIMIALLLGLPACKKGREKVDDTAANVIVRTENRALMLKLKSELQTINRAIEHFHAMHGRYPSSLKELTEKGIMTRIPNEPFGGEWNYNPVTGEVNSGSHPEFGDMSGWDGGL